MIKISVSTSRVQGVRVVRPGAPEVQLGGLIRRAASHRLQARLDARVAKLPDHARRGPAL